MDALERVVTDLTDRVRAGRLPDVRLPARCGPGRPPDRPRLGRRRGLPQPARPPVRHHPRVPAGDPADAGARLGGGAHVRRELQGLGAAGRRAEVRHRRVRLVPRRRAVPGHRLPDRHPRPLGPGPVRHGHPGGPRIPAPARPEEVLEFTYGPGWRVPDPAFHFDHDPADVRRMDAVVPRRRASGYRFWEDFYKTSASAAVPPEESLFARWVAARLDRHGARARRRQRDRPRRGVLRRARSPGDRARLLSAEPAPHPDALRRARARGRQQAPQPRGACGPCCSSAPRSRATPATTGVYARGLLDALGPHRPGRLLAVRVHGPAHAAARRTWSSAPRVSRGEPTFFGAHRRTFLEPDQVVHEIESYGGHVVHRETGRDLAPLGDEDPHVCRTRREVDPMTRRRDRGVRRRLTAPGRRAGGGRRGEPPAQPAARRRRRRGDRPCWSPRPTPRTPGSGRHWTTWRGCSRTTAGLSAACSPRAAGGR